MINFTPLAGRLPLAPEVFSSFPFGVVPLVAPWTDCCSSEDDLETSGARAVNLCRPAQMKFATNNLTAFSMTMVASCMGIICGDIAVREYVS